MSLKTFFLFLFYTDLNSSYLFGGIGKDESLVKRANSTKTSRIRTCFKNIKNLKISKIEDKYFSLEDNYTSLRIYFGGLYF